ncbi:unnamed protein product [Blepharisma stoltei]|uniref:Uncharacterized protein n=1 Tax=Blepharisma stoltei TaxID=1481888 RepID=A0AAU9JQU3_9CILI|nr:unnamed protein product [Blepharisma stoltei]
MIKLNNEPYNRFWYQWILKLFLNNLRYSINKISKKVIWLFLKSIKTINHKNDIELFIIAFQIAILYNPTKALL